MNAERSKMRIGTIAHVDHGKTTLTAALVALSSHLPEPPLGFDYSDQAERQRFFDEAMMPKKLTRKQRRLIAQLKRRRK